jgi:glycosyltransferase involved in cell wall biosynthesis
MKVGLIQNRLGVDGRSRTLAAVIELLNARGLTPDVFSFTGHEGQAPFSSLFKQEARYRLIPIQRPRPLLGDLLQETVLPLLLRRRVADYDLMITSNTGLQGYPNGPELLHLVTFPLELVAQNEDRYREPELRLYGAICGGVGRAVRMVSGRRGQLTANSEFTRDAMVRAYHLSPAEITVLYPPVDVRLGPGSGERWPEVVSLGAYHPDKRQLDAIELARRLPQVTFHIVGSRRSPSYYRNCQAAATGLANVHLLPDAAWGDVETLLRGCKVFLHSKHNEHFGISTVEAISAGCLPVVHDSGGQREIVPFPELRFQSLDEACATILRVLNGRHDDLLPQLQARAESFSKASFQRHLSDLLENLLPRSLSVAA